MLLMIVLYCLAAALFVIGLTLRAELFEDGRLRRKKKPPAPVINIDTGRQRIARLHKHA